MKKYCDCFYKGIACSSDCNCTNCKNSEKDLDIRNAKRMLCREVATPPPGLKKAPVTMEHLQPYKRKFDLGMLPGSAVGLDTKRVCSLNYGVAECVDAVTGKIYPQWLSHNNAQVAIETLASAQQIA